MMNSIELFAGAGGLSLGLEKSGWRSKMLIERNHDACNTLKFNKNNGFKLSNDWNVIEDDVRNIQYEEIDDKIDLVAGGPPCQPFSLGGKHNAYLDERDMFPEAIRAIRDLGPKYFIFENVKGLLRKSFKEYFEYIVVRLKFPYESKRGDESWESHKLRLEKLESENLTYGSKYSYQVSFKLVNAADYGVPQNRHRIIFVGVRDDQQFDFKFPPPTHSLNQLLKDKYLNKSYWKRQNIKTVNDISVYKNLESKIIKLSDQALSEEIEFKPQNTVFSAINNLPSPFNEYNKEWPNHILKLGAKPYPGHTGSSLHFPSKAIKAGVHGVPGGENMIAYQNRTYRYFTTREAARIQTFPDKYIFTGSWTESMRQIGNAVPVKLAEVIGKALFEQAAGNEKEIIKRALQSA